jgi:hypothetical protein
VSRAKSARERCSAILPGGENEKQDKECTRRSYAKRGCNEGWILAERPYCIKIKLKIRISDCINKVVALIKGRKDLRRRGMSGGRTLG